MARFRTAPNPVFLYVYRKHPPAPELLVLVRSKLRGPLLAVQVVQSDGAGFHEEGDRWVFRSQAGVTPLGLAAPEDEIAFAAWLKTRLAGLLSQDG